MEPIKILLIEDNPEDILLIKEYLASDRRYRFECVDVQSLKAALDIISNHDFDAVLLDLTLPDSAGLSTVHEIITQVPETAVIVLTGLQDDEIALQAVRYGAQDFIEKNQLTTIKLGKSVRYAIERKNVLEERKDLLDQLNQAFSYIEELENLLPLCISCKKVMGDDDNWYLLHSLPTRISSSNSNDLICPECRLSISNSKKDNSST